MNQNSLSFIKKLSNHVKKENPISLARRAGVDYSTIYGYLTGRRGKNPAFDTAQKILGAIDSYKREHGGKPYKKHNGNGRAA
jgi:predicted transcriptional regulator